VLDGGLVIRESTMAPAGARRAARRPRAARPDEGGRP
jgi:hypothetical protein